MQYNTAMATLGEIAEKTGVSIATVSRILNHDEKLVVSDSVRLSVLKTARDLNYRTPRQKRERKKAFKIGIADWHIIPNDSESSYSIEYITDSLDTNLDIKFSKMEKDTIYNLDGVIALGEFSEEEKNNLLLSSNNLLFINSNMYLDYSFKRIIIDFDYAFKEAIDFLKAKGCNRISFISGIGHYNGFDIGVRRTKSMENLLKEKNAYNPELFLCDSLKAENGGKLMERALSGNADGIIIANQIMEESALHVLCKSDKKPIVILYRDLGETNPQNDSYPKIMMYPRRIWQDAISILIDGVQKPGEAMNIYIPAQFIENL